MPSLEFWRKNNHSENMESNLIFTRYFSYTQNVIHNTMTYVIHKDKKKIIEVLEWVEINGKMHPKSKKTTYFKSEDKPDFGQKN